METIYLAAGCFWGVQWYFDQLPGVVTTEVGYQGGTIDTPTYEQVCSHTTGHAEAVKIVYDPAIISTDVILRHFFSMHDPTQLNRQGPDVGDNYRSEIFYTRDAQKAAAENVMKQVQQKYAQPIVTRITPAPTFWPAEDYHQKFTERTGRGMCHVSPTEVQL